MTKLLFHFVIAVTFTPHSLLAELYARNGKWSSDGVPSGGVTKLSTKESVHLLQYEDYKHYISTFNENDNELHTTDIPNSESWAFLSANIPLLDVPDKQLEETYYFRWWTYRKHINLRKYVITEFLPNVTWSGVLNTIPCAAAHHFREGRWLHNTKILNGYARFWFDVRGGEKHNSMYSFWPADSLYQYALITGDLSLVKELFTSLVGYHNKIKRTNFDPPTGLYFNTDNRDGMEESISGRPGGIRSYRPSLNSYRYGDGQAISRIAHLIGDEKNAKKFKDEAVRLKKAMEVLWDKDDSFFKSRPYQPPDKRQQIAKLIQVRELIGYTPWYFHMFSEPSSLEFMIDSTDKTHISNRVSSSSGGKDRDSSSISQESSKLEAFKQLFDPLGFSAEYGLTTAERRHPQFKIDYHAKHECLWDGPSWPYATSITLTAVANVVHEKKRIGKNAGNFLSKRDYFQLLKTYALAHRRQVGVATGQQGKVVPVYVPWIDENIDPLTGVWLARDILQRWNHTNVAGVGNTSWPVAKGGKERGKDYNHSTFCDLVIHGLIGLRPRWRDYSLVVNPLVPADTWDYFCLDRVYYHKRWITILWDKTGTRYHRGQGLRVYADGLLVASSPTLTQLKVTLPPLSL